jgi:hypothetical protein
MRSLLPFLAALACIMATVAQSEVRRPPNDPFPGQRLENPPRPDERPGSVIRREDGPTVDRSGSTQRDRHATPPPLGAEAMRATPTVSAGDKIPR